MIGPRTMQYTFKEYEWWYGRYAIREIYPFGTLQRFVVVVLSQWQLVTEPVKLCVSFRHALQHVYFASTPKQALQYIEKTYTPYNGKIYVGEFPHTFSITYKLVDIFDPYQALFGMAVTENTGGITHA